jgi:hypothetical protein
VYNITQVARLKAFRVGLLAQRGLLFAWTKIVGTEKVLNPLIRALCDD